ncbi:MULTISPECIES: tol-pal system protein YbgF [unclassified Rhizobium]|uniref:tol-pal system protein YbgF n=1 Tax=unclassified Rhizobium TaxID=2613769 RepID=UPI001A9A2B0B|nr:MULTISPECIES: tol-pal system protein YbgF [unclassified Rhizobium]MBX5183508.1 tol-pal system protein YbgF [Rhizobium sp. NZLR5]MBX5193268.1 tol-pal system protein YbgF [Rhizobium sp. NZLR3b]MBX5198687.1 tol-pal system protein YbgF [Rhizobium sp. NZLR10]MBX5205850.1 tol-pal system protein YbgF [Rhizobium sp. NZLR1]QSZ20274.1 tol-pal system protein YbgF [Rhizobium sp. NZLR1]
MKKLVVAGMLCLAAVTGSERTAYSASFFGLHLGGRSAENPSALPVVKVQSGDAEVRVQQLEEQLRQLNGRIEEMSFQLLQMQETIRKQQEDNEFRFQQLEKTGASGGGAKAPVKKSETDVAPAASGGDDIAKVIQAPQGAETAPSTDVPANSGLGQPPKELGSIDFDQKGNAIGGSVDENAGIGSGPVPNTANPQQTASLGGEADQYKSAYGHVLSGDYSTAEQEFTQYITRYPSSARAADANFWLGEALYSQGKYNEAAKTFLNAHQKYGTSEKAPEMLLKLGMSLAALDNTETACATLREVSKRYPKASRAVISKVASEQKRLAC